MGEEEERTNGQVNKPSSLIPHFEADNWFQNRPTFLIRYTDCVSRVLIFSPIYLGAPSRLDHCRATPYIVPPDVPIHQYHDTYHRAYLSSLSLEFLHTHPRLYYNIAAFVVHATRRGIQRVSYPNRDIGSSIPSRVLKDGRPYVESTTTQHIWTSASASTYFRLDELILDVLFAITPTTQAQPTSLFTVTES